MGRTTRKGAVPWGPTLQLRDTPSTVGGTDRAHTIESSSRAQSYAFVNGCQRECGVCLYLGPVQEQRCHCGCRCILPGASTPAICQRCSCANPKDQERRTRSTKETLHEIGNRSLARHLGAAVAASAKSGRPRVIAAPASVSRPPDTDAATRATAARWHAGSPERERDGVSSHGVIFASTYTSSCDAARGLRCRDDLSSSKVFCRFGVALCLLHADPLELT